MVVFWKIKGEWTGARGAKFDLIGAILLIFSIVVLMYGLSTLPSVSGAIFIAAGVLGITGFIRWEARTRSPVIELSLFRSNRVFVFSNLTVLIVYSATLPVSMLISLYLQYIIELSPQTAGLVLITTTVVLTIVSPIAGRLSDKANPRKIASVGTVFICIGLSLFIFVVEDIALELIITGSAIFGLGMGLFASPNVNAIMGSVEKKSLGIASGAISTMRSAGQLLGMGVIMILFSVFIGDAEITPEYYPAFLTSMRTAFIILTALCFGSIFTQLAGKNPINV
jgi:MFS family permease